MSPQNLISLPKFNGSPLKNYLPNRKVVFQPPCFRGYVKLRVGIRNYDSNQIDAV